MGNRFVAAVEFTPGGKLYYYWHTYNDLQEGEDLCRNSSNVTVVHPYVFNGARPTSDSARVHRYPNSEKSEGEETMDDSTVKVASVTFPGSIRKYNYFHNFKMLCAGDEVVASKDNRQVVTVIDPNVQDKGQRSLATKWLYGKVCGIDQQEEGQRAQQARIVEAKKRKETFTKMKAQLDTMLKARGIDKDILVYRLLNLDQTLPLDVKCKLAEVINAAAGNEETCI